MSQRYPLRSQRGVCLGLLVLSAGWAQAARRETLRTYPVERGAAVSGVAAGDGLNVWYASPGTDQLGWLTVAQGRPAARQVHRAFSLAPAFIRPWRVAVEPSASGQVRVWFTDPIARRIGKATFDTAHPDQPPTLAVWKEYGSKGWIPGEIIWSQGGQIVYALSSDQTAGVHSQIGFVALENGQDTEVLADTGTSAPIAGLASGASYDVFYTLTDGALGRLFRDAPGVFHAANTPLQPVALRHPAGITLGPTLTGNPAPAGAPTLWLAAADEAGGGAVAVIATSAQQNDRFPIQVTRLFPTRVPVDRIVATASGARDKLLAGSATRPGTLFALHANSRHPERRVLGGGPVMDLSVSPDSSHAVWFADPARDRVGRYGSL